MRTVRTEFRFPLSSVKPLERLTAYREQCLEATLRACRQGTWRRQVSPVSGKRLEPYARIGGLDYGRCPETGSVFLTELPEPIVWRRLLSEVSSLRRLPSGIHQHLASSRSDYVHRPKAEWIQETLQMHGLTGPNLLLAATGPSDLEPHLGAGEHVSEVVVTDEMILAHPDLGLQEEGSPPDGRPFQAAILPESLDRVDDPAKLLRSVVELLAPGGLVFVTALVFSGFEMAVLGQKNLYLYPPDRTNCFTLRGLCLLLEAAGCQLLEVSTPGVLDVEIVRAHLQADPGLPVSPFERQIVLSDETTREGLQEFLQERGLSSFARIVGRRPS